VFLVSARNRGWSNGYYGEAYVNIAKKQIAVTHEGTRGFLTRGWITNILCIVLSKMTARVNSAVTFAYEICQFAKEMGFDVFFIGHSLGGWLAQVTCFTSIYMKLNEQINDFKSRDGNYSDCERHFTIAFDSPGAYQFINMVRLKCFTAEQRKSVDIDILPVENYVFHPNIVNLANFKVCN